MGILSISSVDDGVNIDSAIGRLASAVDCNDFDFDFEPFCMPFDSFDAFGPFDKPFVIDVDCFFFDFWGLSSKLDSVVDAFFLAFFFLPFDASPLVVGDV